MFPDDVDPIFFLVCRLRVLMRECVKDEDFRRPTLPIIVIVKTK
jgi:hypothetical protein